MSRGNKDTSDVDSATYAVLGASFGLLALTTRNSAFRVISAVAGAGLVWRAMTGRKASHVAAGSRHPDEAPAETLHASSGPPRAHLSDVWPSDAVPKH